MNATWFPALLLFIGGLAYLSWLRAKRRREALQSLAKKMGFSYAEQASCSIGGLLLFERGRSGHGYNALTGSSYQDIDIAADPEFSGRFLLRGADEARIRSLFDASLRAACCKHFEGWTVEIGGGRLLVFRAGQTVASEEMRAFLTTSSRIMETLQGARR